MQKITCTISGSLDLLAYRHLVGFASLFLALARLALSPAQAQTTNYTLGTTNLLVGPSAGISSVVIGAPLPSATWAATADSTWLHLDTNNQNGTGSTNVIFTYAANPGVTRSATLTIAGQTVVVTQTGSSYVAVAAGTTLASSGLFGTTGIAVDAAGNIYIADSGHNAIKEWIVTNNSVLTLVSSGLNSPEAVALDADGNVYITDTGDNAIKEWSPGETNAITLVSGLSGPVGIAVDTAGNVYIADTGNNAIEEWTAGGDFVTLVSAGLNNPQGVAVDAAGNVYIADTYNNALKEWILADNTVVTLLWSGLDEPLGIAVDGSGNVYIANYGNGTVKKWAAATQIATAYVFGDQVFVDSPGGVAVDKTGNVYISDQLFHDVAELPYAFVGPTITLEGTAAGSDAFQAVLPGAENLLPPFSPIVQAPWVNVTGFTNGVMSFSFSGTTSNRFGEVEVLGQPVFIAQGSTQPIYSLGTTQRLEGPTAGADSVTLGVVPFASSWTAIADSSWLHLDTNDQSGAGSTNVIFTYDANAGPTRSGTLTIAGQTVNVTQAGSTYVAVSNVTTLLSGTFSFGGEAVDKSGNVYIAGSFLGRSGFTNAIEKWTATNNALTLVVSFGKNMPNRVALDSEGNVYATVSDLTNDNNSIIEWKASDGSTVILLSSGIKNPSALSLDSMGNVYVADEGNDEIEEWTVSNGNLNLVFPFQYFPPPLSMALDAANNIDVGFYNTVLELSVANADLSTLVSGETPLALAADGAGNLYFPEGDNFREWNAATKTFSTLLSGVYGPIGTAVDANGNVYLLQNYVDCCDGILSELPHAFVDPSPKLEGLAAGSDSLPPVLPATENLMPPFAPTSDESWLTITGVTDGVVSFSFTANSGAARTANITLLGQTIPITQGTIGVPPLLTGIELLTNGLLRFSFTNTLSGLFTVISSTNLAVPLSEWTAVGSATNIGPGQFQFTTQLATNDTQLFYIIRSP